MHGYCSSPILWKDKVIVNGDHDGDAYLVALDRATGETVWKTDRPNKTRSYCTPIIRHIDGRNQMILSGSKSVASYDPDTGEQHWVIDGPTEQFVASLVYNEDLELLFMTCGFPERHILAIRPDGHGNVTDTHVVWRDIPGAAYVPSPIAIGPYFLVVADNGVASCFVAETGERLWRERLPREHSASLLAANGLAYFFSDYGVMTVIRPGPDFRRRRPKRPRRTPQRLPRRLRQPPLPPRPPPPLLHRPQQLTFRPGPPVLPLSSCKKPAYLRRYS